MQHQTIKKSMTKQPCSQNSPVLTITIDFYFEMYEASVRQKPSTFVLTNVDTRADLWRKSQSHLPLYNYLVAISDIDTFNIHLPSFFHHFISGTSSHFVFIIPYKRNMSRLDYTYNQIILCITLYTFICAN
jgi:hypothetical protein